ncbi:mas-related G-protein coupled receptor member X1-like [Peromyscus californicus insignis]|uniref:mas-related G-protein coupled receptor member X1-like n=1 Tax=Peromyscus californicus insignis TaxID=564181 RepID=UPI0022A7C085|nr:mas-related G-protein coupled receptor member X1-like [Peromyscus californicus insignis]
MDPTISSHNTESTPTNETDQPKNPNCSPILTLHFLALIIALVGLAGNAIVLWLLGFHMRRKAISVYILNLALADSFFLCCHFIDSLLRVIDFYDIYVHKLGKEILGSAAITPYISGLSILSAISTERCLSVLWPFWYHCHRPKNMSTIICALIWVLSFLMSILEWYCSGLLSDVHHHLWKNVDFIVTAFLIFLFMLLFGSSVTLLVRILCGSRRNPLTRLYVTISLTVMVFLICGLPLGLYLFLLFWLDIHLHYPFCHLYRITTVLSCVNSCANPIIYFFVGSFRQHRRHRSLRMVLQRALEDTPEEDECTKSHLQKTIEMSESREW